MEFLKALVYILILSAVLIYTLSYAIHEFKEKNILAASGVLIICVFLVLVPVLLVIFN